MDGLVASPGISAISASTEQRLLLGNIVDEGGGRKLPIATATQNMR